MACAVVVTASPLSARTVTATARTARTVIAPAICPAEEVIDEGGILDFSDSEAVGGTGLGLATGVI